MFDKALNALLGLLISTAIIILSNLSNKTNKQTKTKKKKKKNGNKQIKNK